jgi:hypothetical protein
MNFICKEFTENSYCIKFTFQDLTFITGSVFTEKYFFKSENLSRKNNFFNNFQDSENLIDFLKDANFIVITEFNELICWPYIAKKFKLSAKFLTTEPILQIGKVYLNDFYTDLNNLIIDNEFENIFISELDINDFIENSVKLNFNQKFAIQNSLKLILTSSGYSLGSSNIILEYFNKNIFILCESSFYDFRYPKPFDTSLIKDNDVDLVIIKPNVFNTDSDCIKTMNNLTTNIYNITSKFDINSSHYANIFIPCEPLFLLDFVDYMRFKISKENKNIFLGKSIKAILDYSNVSHGFINQAIHNKIYEFMLPFNFDELIKNSK